MTSPAVPLRVRPLVLGANAVTGGPVYDVALGPVLLRQGLADTREFIRLFTPEPTAAFSRRDCKQRGFPAAVAAVTVAGFAPVLRGPGGRLAAYHTGSVVVDHVVRVQGAQEGVIERFHQYAALHTAVLSGLGLDARVGELPGEYCPGQYSVNAAGVAKVVGSAQRITRDGWLFSSVFQVTGSNMLAEALTEPYRALGYDLDMSTIGTIEDFLPGMSTDIVMRALLRAYAGDEFDSLEILPGHIRHEVQKVAPSLDSQLELGPGDPLA